ncbi:MAG: hypothetical protein GC182_11660 [Rhodopseudomonas sp.]|nr:hypothetical protein [Rhodopseudomonas sp.]
MREEKQASKSANDGELSREQWCNEIIGDVFELWIGISRLMARIQEPQPLRDRTSRPASRRSKGKRPTARRVARRKTVDDRSAA